MSKIKLPVKRGNFVEFRTGMINISPIGRSCSKTERDDFEKYDKIHNVRNEFIKNIKENLPDIGLTYSIGESTTVYILQGQIDVPIILIYVV